MCPSIGITYSVSSWVDLGISILVWLNMVETKFYCSYTIGFGGTLIYIFNCISRIKQYYYTLNMFWESLIMFMWGSIDITSNTAKVFYCNGIQWEKNISNQLLMLACLAMSLVALTTFRERLWCAYGYMDS